MPAWARSALSPLVTLRNRTDFNEGAVSDQLGDADGRPSRIRLCDEHVFHLHESTQVLVEAHVIGRDFYDMTNLEARLQQVGSQETKRILKLLLWFRCN